MTSESRPFDLSNLQRVPLLPEQTDALARMRAGSLGSGAWRAFKDVTLRKLFGLEQISGGRLQILAADACTEIRAVVRLQVPVPCLPQGKTELVIESRADLALFYPDEVMCRPLPGHALIEILAPRAVYHPNVSSGASQRLCLGANVARGFPLHEAVLAAYAALSLQAVTVDERDPAGVMNFEAALYLQAHAERIPLSREPFLPCPRPVEAS